VLPSPRQFLTDRLNFVVQDSRLRDGLPMSPSAAVSDYQSVLSFLFGRIDYERIAVPRDSAGFKLQIMRDLLNQLDNPHHGQRIVHVAGTKGKGSTASMISAILVEAGYPTGLYTSPHLDRIEERIRIDGIPVNADHFVERMQEMIPIVERMDREAESGRAERGPTFFEITTALAFLHFARQRVEFTVLEVGLGGRLDSTNVCDPLVSVITSISFDHTKVLGETLAAIAAEKAGIIKPRVPVVCGVTDPEPLAVIERIAQQRDCPIRLLGRDFRCDFPLNGKAHSIHPGSSVPHPHPTFSYTKLNPLGGSPKRYDDIKLNLLGRHQATNAALAIASAEQLRSLGWSISEGATRRGLATVKCPARVEIVSRSPLIVVDAAHNVASVRALMETVDTNFKFDNSSLIFATSRDKDCASMLHELLPSFDRILLTRFIDNPRAMPLDRLETTARRIAAQPNGERERVIQVYDTPDSAWHAACSVATETDLICICGSSFIAAEIRRIVEPSRTAGCDESRADVSP